MTDALDALEAELRRHRPSPRWDVSGRVATGVCVPIVDAEPEGIETWVIVRPASLRDHAGELCFPGGKPEPGDADLEATAVREAAEELGIPAPAFRIVAPLSPIPIATSRYALHPVVAVVDRAHQPSPAPSEVAELIRAPLLAFFDERVVFEAVDMGDYSSPMFRFSRGILMFGASAHVLLELLAVFARVEGRSLPDPVMVDTAPWERQRTATPPTA